MGEPFLVLKYIVNSCAGAIASRCQSAGIYFVLSCVLQSTLMPSSGLIGYTGFVGSHLSRAVSFDACYNSQNIADIHGQAFDLLICAAPQAKKWWANQYPDEDLAMVKQLTAQLEQIHAERFVLISSIDVFPRIVDADETFDCAESENHAYGQHRLLLEQFVATQFPQSFIVRLPGLFGAGLKKNVIFDLLHHNQLEKINPDSQFQWYDITQLWTHLQIVLAKDLRLVMLATEPVVTSDIQCRFFPSLSIGTQAPPPIYYNIQTRYSELFGGDRSYIQNREQVLDRIGKFVAAEQGQLV